MSTNEEFHEAIKFLISCRGSVSCGCVFDEALADSLYSQCKRYIDDYKKYFMNI